MSLDVMLMDGDELLFDRNITHNLTDMAIEIGIYRHLWKPNEMGITRAEELIIPIKMAMRELYRGKNKYKEFEPENGWGTLEDFYNFMKHYVDACIRYPDSKVFTDI